VQREEEDEDEDEEGEELELRIPGSFSFENVGGGAAQGAMGCEFGQPVRCGRYAREFVEARAAAMNVRPVNSFRFQFRTTTLRL
jgi:hypothetical protein